MTKSVKVNGKSVSMALDVAEEYPNFIFEIIKEGQYIHDEIFNID